MQVVLNMVIDHQNGNVDAVAGSGNEQQDGGI
jgi:hypothetical protein